MWRVYWGCVVSATGCPEGILGLCSVVSATGCPEGILRLCSVVSATGCPEGILGLCSVCYRVCGGYTGAV